MKRKKEKVFPARGIGALMENMKAFDMIIMFQGPLLHFGMSEIKLFSTFNKIHPLTIDVDSQK